MRVYGEQQPPPQNKSCVIMIGIGLVAIAVLSFLGMATVSIGEYQILGRKKPHASPPPSPPQQSTTAPQPAVTTSLGVDLILQAAPEGIVSGQWKFEKDSIRSDASQGARLQFPVQVPDEYDIEMAFTRLSGDSTVNLLLARREKHFGFTIGLNNSTTLGFFDVPGPSSNTTARKFALKNGQRYAVRIEVRAKGVKAFVNGALVTFWVTDFSSTGRWQGWSLRDNTKLGIGTWESETVFHSIRLIDRGTPSKPPEEF